MPGQAAITVVSDPTLSPMQKTLAMQIIRNARKDESPLITTEDIVKGAIGAGLGYGAARVTGSVLGSIFGLSAENQTTLARIGALGGALRNTGIWR